MEPPSPSPSSDASLGAFSLGAPELGSSPQGETSPRTGSEVAVEPSRVGSKHRNANPLRDLQMRLATVQGDVQKLRRQIMNIREGLRLSKRRERDEMMNTLEKLRLDKGVLEAEEEVLLQEISRIFREVR